MAWPLVLAMVFIGGCASPRPCDPDFIRADLSERPPKACQVDGCTLAPDLDAAMGECCDRHDAIYWSGGSRSERQQADLDFRQCLLDADYSTIGDIYYLGVRIGGSPHLPTPWRWGFGWDYPRGYYED
jgi:hypothetical protein